MVIRITNFIRKLKKEPLIYKTGEALIQIRYYSGEVKSYSAKFEKIKSFNKKNISPEVFHIFIADEILYVPDLIMRKEKVYALLYSDHIFYKENWIDPKKQISIWNGWFRL